MTARAHAARRARSVDGDAHDGATAVLWSGGKDCFAAALRCGALEDPRTILLTAVPADEPAAFRCHPLPLIAQQAAALGLRHERVPIPREGWEAAYRALFARLADASVARVVTGDLVVERWLRDGTAAAGLALETPLARDADPAAVLDILAARDVVAIVTGMRDDHYRPTFLGRPIGRSLLAEHDLTDAERFHPAGENGEYHTVVTAFGGRRLIDADLAALPHVAREGVWSLDHSAAPATAGTVMSENH